MRGKREDTYARRKVASSISMSLNAWTALDYMASDEGCSVSAMMERLIDDEAKRRLEKSRERKKAEYRAAHGIVG